MKALFQGALLQNLREAGCDIVLPKNVEEEALSQLAAEKNSKRTPPDEKPEAHMEQEQEFDDSVISSDSPQSTTNTPVTGRERFLNLVELFPPLPQKGDFEVRTVKDSLYFFS